METEILKISMQRFTSAIDILVWSQLASETRVQL